MAADMQFLRKKKEALLLGTFIEQLQTHALKAWGLCHYTNPVPKLAEKKELAKFSGKNLRQVSDWFTNWRQRQWKPVFLKGRHRWRRTIVKVQAARVFIRMLAE